MPPHFPDEIWYSDKYCDATHEYRHVALTKAITREMINVAGGLRLLSEDEWRSLGVQQSLGWVHYDIFRPEPHILMFRRELGTDPLTGTVVPDGSHATG